MQNNFQRKAALVVVVVAVVETVVVEVLKINVVVGMTPHFRKRDARMTNDFRRGRPRPRLSSSFAPTSQFCQFQQFIFAKCCLYRLRDLDHVLAWLYKNLNSMAG